jgi:hypothetical protein
MKKGMKECSWENTTAGKYDVSSKTYGRHCFR